MANRKQAESFVSVPFCVCLVQRVYIVCVTANVEPRIYLLSRFFVGSSIVDIQECFCTQMFDFLFFEFCCCRFIS